MNDASPRPPRSPLERCEIERTTYHREWTRAIRRIEDALTHYQIGRDASALVSPTFVDWQYVAAEMAKALRGEAEAHPQPVAPRDFTREPEDDGDPEATARLWDGH